MKKKFIIMGIILFVISGLLGYFGTLYLDQIKKGGNVDISITFEDTEEFQMENNKRLNRESALKEWPYIIHLENKGSATGLYQIKIEDSKDNTIKRDDLSYVLLMNDQEIKTGELSELKDDVLYQGEAKNNSKQDFKLYIWSNTDYQEEDIYKYKLNIEAIKTGGPGF